MEGKNKAIAPTVAEDPGDALSRLRADALLAVATDAAASMQLERLSNGRRKAGWREAKAAAEGQGPQIVRSLAVLATSRNGIRIASVASRHWRHARDVLRACKEIGEQA